MVHDMIRELTVIATEPDALAPLHFENARQKKGESIRAWHSRIIALHAQAGGHRRCDASRLVRMFWRGLRECQIESLTAELHAARAQASFVASTSAMHASSGHEQGYQQPGSYSQFRAWEHEVSGKKQ